jgi:hypothetical protein
LAECATSVIRACNIGRGFIGRLLHESGYDICPQQLLRGNKKVPLSRRYFSCCLQGIKK